MPLCGICDREVDDTNECEGCGQEFCEHCGDQVRKVCDVCRQRDDDSYNSDMEYEY